MADMSAASETDLTTSTPRKGGNFKTGVVDIQSLSGLHLASPRFWPNGERAPEVPLRARGPRPWFVVVKEGEWLGEGRV